MKNKIIKKDEVIKFLEKHLKEWDNNCMVANREGMPKMYDYWVKRVDAIQLVISVLR